jgi:hypothetical protein
VHGGPTADFKACIRANGVRLGLVNNVVTECHSKFDDAQAVSAWQGAGVLVDNNYLAGAAETIGIGGSSIPSIPNHVPEDWTITRNDIAKPMAWKNAWLVKNLVEVKAGRRILIEGNVLENSWPSGQAGFAFVLWSATSGCSWCVTEDLTIRNNLIRNVAGGFNLAARYDGTTIPLRRVAITNNVLIGVDNAAVAGNGRLFTINDNIADLTIEHNTGFSPSNSSFVWGGQLPLTRHIVKNNLVGGGQYQLFTSAGQGQTAWNTAGDTASRFLNNAVANFSGGTMVAGNFAGTFAAFGIANPYSATATLDDFVLPASSVLKGKATDGRDVGADIAAVKAATAGVVQPVVLSAKRIPVRKP